MLIGEVVKKYPESIGIMLEHGLHCVGCHVATWETIEQGAIGHGIDVNKLVRDINEKIKVVWNIRNRHSQSPNFSSESKRAISECAQEHAPLFREAVLDNMKMFSKAKKCLHFLWFWKNCLRAGFSSVNVRNVWIRAVWEEWQCGGMIVSIKSPWMDWIKWFEPRQKAKQKIDIYGK